MKISYRTHPILDKLQTKEIGKFSCFKSDIEFVSRNMNYISDSFKKTALGINHQIYHLTDPFIDAYEKAGEKLFHSNLWSDIEDDNLCFIHRCFDDTKAKESTLINIRNNQNSKLIFANVFAFRDIAIESFGTYCFDYRNGKPEIFQTAWLSNSIKSFHLHVQNCLLMTLFIKYANVEIKNLKAGQKEKDINCKYVNETRMPINILDSTWFTTLVKSGAFKVRGHFRLQPCGEGLKDRKLIWINEFEKEGYTAPARKLSQA